MCCAPMAVCLVRKRDDEGWCCYTLCVTTICVIPLIVLVFVMLAVFGVFNVIDAIQNGSGGSSSNGTSVGSGGGGNSSTNYTDPISVCGNDCIIYQPSSSGGAVGVGSSTASVNSYESQVLMDNPIAYLKFNDLHNSIPAEANWATSTADASWGWTFSSTAWTANQPGVLPVGDTSIRWLGTASCSSYPNADVVTNVLTIPTTVELWFRTSASSDSGPFVAYLDSNSICSPGTMLCETETVVNPYYLYVWMTNTGQVAMTINDDITYGSISTTRVYSGHGYNDGNNHHVIAVYNPQELTITLYVDGLVVTSQVFSEFNEYSFFQSYTGFWQVAAIPTANNGGVMDTQFSSFNWPGYLGQVSIYENTALTPSRVQAHYLAAGGIIHSGAALDMSPTLSSDSQLYANVVIDDGPLFYWPMNDKGATVTNVMDAMGSYLGVFNQSVSNFTLTGETSGIAFQSAGTSIVTAQMFPFGSSVAFEIWVRPWVNVSSQLMTFSGGLYTYLTDNGAIRVGIHNATATTAAMLVNDNLWHQVVVTYRQQVGLWLYVDGNLQVGLTPDQLPSIVGSIGRWSIHGALGTSVKRTSVYNSTLSAVQINNHWTTGTL